ncbi:alkylated DNA repair protein (DNA oxidative demethylase) [Izhakiella capsodis]|uniref:Alkylated DNA repair protein (DNA oxidative demethylase) n=1 Tax=Izhakiella capsodis TaxID=1367852 RepID=A0A1I4Y0D1_9GAMM|nr:DNA oxidative demethylase AlkB [Izhakiella capsodis]SFN31522.1 alkylated DNA repair protein (DNA oxidative demethylase) [Izhakiella capsodis]
MLDLFSGEAPWSETLADGAQVQRRRALAVADELLANIDAIAKLNPFYHRITPGGHRMSVAMTNCGDFGWATHARGYHYSRQDQNSAQNWPAMPALFYSLAVAAAEEAGFTGFNPDACLINRYEPGARMTLHQDKDEKDLRQPVVSISLGLPAIFQFGGFERDAATQRILLEHGDIVVWGGSSRLRYHGVLPLKADIHPQCGAFRYNLTFRRAF